MEHVITPEIEELLVKELGNPEVGPPPKSYSL
jgi:hypothetical protein